MLIGWMSGIGQKYITIGDISGDNSITENISELESNSVSLVNSLPSTFRDSVKVFDFGLYIHNQSMSGQNEINNIYNSVFSQVNSQSKYYLFFFRVLYYDGKTAHKVLLNLPSNLYPSCSSKAKYDILQDQLEDLLNSSTSSVGKTEINVINELKTILLSFSQGNCCPITNEQIIKKLVDLEFIPFSEEQIEEDNAPFSIYDFGKCKYQGQNIIQMMNNKLNGLPGPKKFILTDNDNICVDNKFDEAKSVYESNLTDFDVWVHIFKTTDETIWFLRFEQNIDLGSPISSFNDRDNDSRKSIIFQDDSFVGYLSSDANRNDEPGSGGNDKDTDSDPCPTYIVKNNGETFASIVTLYEYDFLYADLQRWNPGINGNNLSAGQKILLFLEECAEESADDDSETSVPFDPTFNSYRWIYPNSKIKEEMRSNGFTEETIGVFIKQPVKLTHVPVSEKIPLSNYVVDKDLGIVKKSNPVLTRVVKFLDKITPSVTTLGKGVNVIGLIISSPFELNPHEGNLNHHFIYPLTSPQLQALKIDAQRLRKLIFYVTYTKFLPNKPGKINANGEKLKDGRVYAGRSRGSNRSPCQIVATRDAAHVILNLKENFQPALLDQWFPATRPVKERWEDESYQKMRGREELIIEAMGGPDYGPLSYTRARNRIRGISLTNGRRALYIAMALPLQPTPHVNWDGPVDFCH
jgi:hypothetical protein